MEYALLQAVFLPLLLSPVAYILGRKVGPTPAMWFTFAILLYTTILAMIRLTEFQMKPFGIML